MQPMPADDNDDTTFVNAHTHTHTHTHTTPTRRTTQNNRLARTAVSSERAATCSGRSPPRKSTRFRRTLEFARLTDNLVGKEFELGECDADVSAPFNTAVQYWCLIVRATHQFYPIQSLLCRYCSPINTKSTTHETKAQKTLMIYGAM
jgi:hypothetical protein